MIKLYKCSNSEHFAIFAVLLLYVTTKGKDRVCYICYGVWIGCFAMDQIIGVPGMIADMDKLLRKKGA